ncbi:MAG: type III pantothenate kinase [Clostridia bacterium]|nr:type III pantothenate kinase [Clostridia bacterium]
MILTLDIGNTNIVIGGFLNDELQFVSRISTNSKKTEDEYAALIKSIVHLNDIRSAEVKGAIISSVVPPLNKTMQKALKKVFNISSMIVGPGIKTGVNLLVDNPSQVGADLVCSAAAAYKYYDSPALILDMGTATKLSVIDEKGAFLGVSIIPGIEIGINALAGGTAQLPQISLEAPKSVIGKNTVDAMQSGVVFGNASLIDGMIERIKKEFGENINIIATGGLASFIIPYCKEKMTLDDNLILKGLYAIYQKNI